ncbi:hypothetical protein BsWGS_25743 [Bradybaena similaris]
MQGRFTFCFHTDKQMVWHEKLEGKQIQNGSIMFTSWTCRNQSNYTMEEQQPIKLHHKGAATNQIAPQRSSNQSDYTMKEQQPIRLHHEGAATNQITPSNQSDVCGVRKCERS